MYPAQPLSGPVQCRFRFCQPLVSGAVALLVSSTAGCYHYVPSQRSDLTPAGLAETRVRVKSATVEMELEDAKYQEPVLEGTLISIARPIPGFEVNRRVTLAADISAIDVLRLNKGVTGVLVVGSIVTSAVTLWAVIVLSVYWSAKPEVRAAAGDPTQALLTVPGPLAR